MWFHLTRGFPWNLSPSSSRSLSIWYSGTLWESPTLPHQGEMVWERISRAHGFHFYDLITKQALPIDRFESWYLG